jgi:Xaa-Pro aminopeptidase
MAPSQEIKERVAAFRSATPDAVRVVHGRANVRYLTGYDGGGFPPSLLIGDEGMTIVFYTADEDSMAALSGSGIELRPYTPTDDPQQVLASALTFMAPTARLVGDLDWWSHRDVASFGPPITDCSGALRNLRVVKSPWEQAQLRKAGQITTRTMQTLESLASQGATARELGATFFESAIRLGSAPFTYIPYLAVGAATFQNHTTWDYGSDKCGPYLFEFATNVEGYGTPLSHSRTEHPDGLRAIGAIEQGIEAIKSRLRPGADPRDLYELMTHAIEGAGFHFAHRAGYSIGLGESETWMEGNLALLGPHADYSIRQGMAFHVVGSVVERGRFGVAKSNSLLVVEDGYEVMSQ